MAMNFSIALAQMAVETGRPEENLAKARGWIAQAKGRGAQLVLFPEMWTVGFNWERNAALKARYETDSERVALMAREHGIWVAGSMPFGEDDGRISNALMVFNPAGQRAALYRKIHLFSLFDEPQHVAAGNELVAVETPWAKMGLSVCYDLRFPELFRAYAIAGVQVQLCPSAWPTTRLEHWQTLIRARAIEDQMFMVAVNQAGTEDFGSKGQVTYAGHSAIIDPWGTTIVEAGDGEELAIGTIDTDAVDAVRAKMSVLKDRREDLY